MALILMALHVFVCLFLIFVVLLQSAQAADLAGAFGGGGSQTALGMRGATTLLQKATTGAAVVFMLTSLGLGLVGREESSLIQGLEEPAATAPSESQGAQERPEQTGQEPGAAQEQGAASQAQASSEDEAPAQPASGQERSGGGTQQGGHGTGTSSSGAAAR